MSDRGLPANIDAERLVLGATLQDEALMHTARPLLVPEAFHLRRHQQIWRRACELYDSGKPVDMASVGVSLQLHDEDPERDILSYLADLTVSAGGLLRIDNSVATVNEKAALRNLIAGAQHTMNRCMAGMDSSREIIEGINQHLTGIAAQKNGDGLRSIAELIDQIGFSALMAPRKERGLMFPWPWMNHHTSGMLPAELWVLAAHTSNGKTSAMLQHAVAAARGGAGVAVFSLEVGPVSLFQKALCQQARVASDNFRRNEMSTAERHATNEAAAELSELGLYLDTQSTTVMAIHAALRQRVLKNKISHVIVDYLQLLGNSGRFENRAQQVSANTWALKMLATDFQVPVLLLSQFSRGMKGEARAPVLSDLKESGDIENHANGVWFIHRESQEDSDTVPVQFMLPKQRDGRRNIFKNLNFLPRFQRFEEPTGEGEWNDR